MSWDLEEAIEFYKTEEIKPPDSRVRWLLWCSDGKPEPDLAEMEYDSLSYLL